MESRSDSTFKQKKIGIFFTSKVFSGFSILLLKNWLITFTVQDTITAYISYFSKKRVVTFLSSWIVY